MSKVQVGHRARLDVVVGTTDLPANVAQRFLAPEDGALLEMAVVVTHAVTTGGTITIQKRLGTPVDGLQVAIPNGAAVGSLFRATANKADVNRPCARDDVHRVAPDGFGGAGGVRVSVTIATNDNPQNPY